LLQLIALRFLLIVSGARHVARFDQTLEASQLLLGQIECDARRADFRHAVHVERSIRLEADARLRLSDGRLRLRRLRLQLP
jgi:hypothetical protein